MGNDIENKNLSTSELIAKLKKKPGRGTIRKKPGLTTKGMMDNARAMLRRGHAVLLIDCSGSMSGKCILEAKKGAKQFVDIAIGKNYKVGIVGFADTSWKQAAIGNNNGLLKTAIDDLVLGATTDMAGAINLGRQMLRQEEVQQGVICIATDGLANDVHETITQADSAKSEGFDIMCIGTEAADHEFLKQIASRKELAEYSNPDDFGKTIANMSSQYFLPKM